MPDPQEPCRNPVFVLSASRSGSTLLRFVLDSHPDFACPPETTFAAVGALLARTWDILRGAQAEGRPATEPWQPSSAAISAVREVMDKAFGQYLRRREKGRWCDKSLNTYQYADLICLLYPEAKFICLYRHCMDMIASGIEACPLGLTGYGFDPYVARNPGNSVAAIGSYWLETVQAIMTFEEQHAESCHRVRYEDLVSAPEETAATIFSFLGARQVPGITRACFANPHEANGPGDEKIWFTKGVTTESLGRGGDILADALPPPVRQAINEKLAKLDYRIVDDGWNAVGRIDPRANLETAVTSANGQVADRWLRPDTMVRAIADRISSLSDDRLREISTRWLGPAGSTVRIVALAADGEPHELRRTFGETGAAGPATWGVPESAAAGGSCPPGDAPFPEADDMRPSDTGSPTVTLIASLGTWDSLLARRANVVTEVRAGRLRCVRHTTPGASQRHRYRARTDDMHAVAALFDLDRVPFGRDRTEDHAAAPLSAGTDD